MNPIKTLLRTATAGLIIGITGCCTTVQDSKQHNLQLMLDEARNQVFEKYGTEEPIGLMLYAINGDDEYFVCSNMPEGITPDSFMRIASATKTFVAASILLLEQQGKLNIDDTVVMNIPGKDIPYLPNNEFYQIPHKKDITIRQLLQHNAAVFDVSDAAIPESTQAPYAGESYTDYQTEKDIFHTFTADELAAVISKYQLEFGKPGDIGLYSNAGYTLLAKIVERVSEKPIDVFITENLLIPNGLNHTHMVVRAEERNLPQPAIDGFSGRPGKLTRGVESNLTRYLSSGNMISTPRDIANWMRLLYSGQAGLSPETVQQMTDPGQCDYALGTMNYQKRAFGHNGALNGYFSMNYYDPQTNTAWTLLANYARFGDNFAGQIAAMEEFEGKMLNLFAGETQSNPNEAQ